MPNKGTFNNPNKGTPMPDFTSYKDFAQENIQQTFSLGVNHG